MFFGFLNIMKTVLKLVLSFGTNRNSTLQTLFFLILESSENNFSTRWNGRDEKEEIASLSLVIFGRITNKPVMMFNLTSSMTNLSTYLSPRMMSIRVHFEGSEVTSFNMLSSERMSSMMWDLMRSWKILGPLDHTRSGFIFLLMHSQFL